MKGKVLVSLLVAVFTGTAWAYDTSKEGFVQTFRDDQARVTVPPNKEFVILRIHSSGAGAFALKVDEQTVVSWALAEYSGLDQYTQDFPDGTFVVKGGSTWRPITNTDGHLTVVGYLWIPPEHEFCPGDMDGDGWLSADDVSILVDMLLPHANNGYWLQCP